MANLDEMLSEVVEVAHMFEVDLNTVVLVNHQLTIDGIASLEEREVERIREEFAAEDPEVLSSIVRDQEGFCDELREAARNLALVGLVTRFEHWIKRFSGEVKGPRKRQRTRSSRQGSELVRRIKELNGSLGEGPVRSEFFQALVTARDSVIHGDSRAQWGGRGDKRKVAECYRDGSSVHVSEEQLKDAGAKATEQVKWYDQKLESLRTRPSLPTARPGA